MKNIEFFLIILTTLIIFSQEQPYPVVLMHGLDQNATTIKPVINWIHKYLGDDVYVKSVEIGDGFWNSFFYKMFDAVNEFCSKVKSDPILKNATKINVIGHSQGGLIARGYVEFCNDPPVHNLITWVTPHQGLFGFPKEEYKWLDKILQSSAYIKEIQDTITVAQYWKDPLNYNLYLEKSIFLPYLNNEIADKNEQIKKNIMSLNSLTLVLSNVDDIINPKESAWFAFFDDKFQNIIPYNETQLYLEDWIGIRYLDENKKLNFQATNCRHEDLPLYCESDFVKITLPLLK
eukprot:Anaeramoba_ignava/a348541_12.p1 GENE.a348541_12~~a348541_12.p1  ORF type:complete len:290 (+),score=74.50 a348541_12:11-880(+)